MISATRTLSARLAVPIGALVIWIVATIANGSLHLMHGLTAEYFDTLERTGAPIISAIDPEVSTSTLLRHWPDGPPPSFSARWAGYLPINAAHFYQFATTSDDGSWLYIDGQLVVNNGGTHGSQTQVGRVWLDGGSHFVLIEYVQEGGSYAIDWSWARDDRTFAAVPGWMLSPRRVSYTALVISRVLTWVSWSAVFIVVGACIWIGLQVSRGWSRRAIRQHPQAECLVLFVALAVVHTWPLATAPGRLSRNDNGDTVLNEWVLAWIAHQVPLAPLELFNANIFYPERNTLAYSELLLPQAVMGAPLLWAGASPVLTHNVLLIAGIASTGWAMCLVVARWTGDWIGGITSGIVIAFSAHTLTRLPHLQAQHVEFLPFALLALDALLTQPRMRHAAGVAVFFVLQALTSFYLMLFTTVALVVATLARPEAWRRGRISKLAPHALIAVAVVAIVLAPFLGPYWRVHRDMGFSRSLEDVAGYSASWRDYLTTPATIHRQWSPGLAGRYGLFPGVAGLGLAIWALVTGRALTDPRPRMCLAAGLCGVALSFGPKMPGYELLYRTFPPLQGIRAVGRFGYLGLFAVAVLAGYGVAEIRRRVANPTLSAAMSLAIVSIVALEPLAAPISYTAFNGISSFYDRLQSEPSAVVAELPLPPPRDVFLNAAYMLNSTTHWKPLLNGYSGFVPMSYYQHYEAIKEFPWRDAIAALQEAGVTHLVVHRASFPPATVAEIDRSPALRRTASDGTMTLYALRPASAR